MNRKPWRRVCQTVIDVLDIPNPLSAQPVVKRNRAFLHKNLHPVFPRGASAQNSGKLHSRFHRKFQGMQKRLVSHALRQINEARL
jgi:hypothetical protein